jgi:hypothetical protein
MEAGDVQTGKSSAAAKVKASSHPPQAHEVFRPIRDIAFSPSGLTVSR